MCSGLPFWSVWRGLGVRAEAAMMQLGGLHWWEEEDWGWRRQQLGQHLKQVVLYAAVDSGGCRLHPASARRRWGECSHSTVALSAPLMVLGDSQRNSAETNKQDSHSYANLFWIWADKMLNIKLDMYQWQFRTALLSSLRPLVVGIFAFALFCHISLILTLTSAAILSIANPSTVSWNQSNQSN